MQEIEISAIAGPLSATVEMPGSKSITNRVLILAAIADGRSTIDQALLSHDTRYMTDALKALGFRVELDEGRRRIAVEGTGGRIPASKADLFVGNAGTAMRFLLGLLTLSHGRFRLDGNARMRERPVGPLIAALSRLGAVVSSERADGCPPVVFENPAPVSGGELSIDASVSSQFVSALLMPAPLWPQGLRLTVTGDTARPFIDMTLGLMAAFGAGGAWEGDALVVPGNRRYRAREFTVEPDASSASYFAAAAALLGGSVTIHRLRAESVQGDIRFLDVLEKMGARVRWLADGVEVSSDGHLRGVEVAMNSMPDMVPTLAALAPFATSPTRIRNVAFIRHHESDRLRALATELARLGASVAEFDDGLLIEPSRLRPAAVETYDDHRIAMAFAVVGLKVAGLRIRNPGCVAKTYPGFFDDLSRLAA